MKIAVTYIPILRKMACVLSDLTNHNPDLVMTIKKIPAVLFLIPLLAFSQCRKNGLLPVNSPDKATAKDTLGVKLKDMFGINGYEWNILQDPNNVNDALHVFEPNWAIIKGIGAFRHYMDWEKLESEPGSFTFNPVHSGGWNYDAIYQRAKQDSVFMLADLKTVPGWFLNAYYPADLRDGEDVPAPYGSDRSSPDSYLLQAKAAFQFAARYGYNAAIPPALVTVNTTPRWTADPVNEVKIGMGLVKYIECDNERDKWWKGAKAQQTAQEYAANMSAFYDGNKGKMGKNAGVKTADPNMLVVMGGLADANVQYVKDMIEWCRVNRGYRSNGSIDLCFDVINYHYYANNVVGTEARTQGYAPELSIGGKDADDFVKLAKTVNLPVWITETGYDINSASPQRAVPIGNKTTLITQADWILRTSLMYARHGIARVFFYQMYDDVTNGGGQYMTSGLADNLKRRPSADYIFQVNKLMGSYYYAGTLSTDPLVDKYVLGNKTIYALMIPDQKGRVGTYMLDLGKASLANIYTPAAGKDAAVKTTVPTVGGKVLINVTETPVFVQAN